MTRMEELREFYHKERKSRTKEELDHLSPEQLTKLGYEHIQGLGWIHR